MSSSQKAHGLGLDLGLCCIGYLAYLLRASSSIERFGGCLKYEWALIVWIILGRPRAHIFRPWVGLALWDLSSNQARADEYLTFTLGVSEEKCS